MTEIWYSKRYNTRTELLRNLEEIVKHQFSNNCLHYFKGKRFLLEKYIGDYAFHKLHVNLISKTNDADIKNSSSETIRHWLENLIGKILYVDHYRVKIKRSKLLTYNYNYHKELNIAIIYMLERGYVRGMV